MTDSAALDTFLQKWRTRWPEWAIAEAFVPASQRPLAQAWLALRGELAGAAWGGEDPTPGAAKLGWWEEELRGWARGARRHPLGLALQRQPVDWARLADGIPALRLRRQPEGDQAQTLAGLAGYAQGLATVSAALFCAPAPSGDAMAQALLAEWRLLLPRRGVPAAGTDLASVLALPALREGPRVERIQAALVRLRLRRQDGQAPLGAPRVLLAAWRAARG